MTYCLSFCLCVPSPYCRVKILKDCVEMEGPDALVVCNALLFDGNREGRSWNGGVCIYRRFG